MQTANNRNKDVVNAQFIGGTDYIINLVSLTKVSFSYPVSQDDSSQRAHVRIRHLLDFVRII